MKRTMFVVLFFIFCAVLYGNSSFHEMLTAYEQMQEQKLDFDSRMDYTYFITVFLPPGFSTVMFANENLYQEQIYYQWDTAWLEAIRYEFTYSNDLVLEYSMLMGGLVYHYDITYDANDMPYQSILSMDMGTGFQNFMRETFEYNANGVLNSYLAEYWQGVNWGNGLQWLMTLDGDHIISILTQEWDTDNQVWQDEESVTLTWDGDNVTENFREEWIDEAWENDRLREYTYSNGNLVEIYEQDWIATNWENSQLIDLAWENGVMNHQLYMVWDGTEWVDGMDYTTTYENGKPIENIALEWTGTEWLNYSKVEYIYDTGTSPHYIPNPQIQMRNYPNPFNPETTIAFNIQEGKTGTLEIYNLKGQMIHSQNFESGDHTFVWNADSQASGIYFYNVTSESNQLTKKMILLK
jgi:Secretion system C-terminal sorting domain